MAARRRNILHIYISYIYMIYIYILAPRHHTAPAATHPEFQSVQPAMGSSPAYFYWFRLPHAALHSVAMAASPVITCTTSTTRITHAAAAVAHSTTSSTPASAALITSLWNLFVEQWLTRFVLFFILVERSRTHPWVAWLVDVQVWGSGIRMYEI